MRRDLRKLKVVAGEGAEDVFVAGVGGFFGLGASTSLRPMVASSMRRTSNPWSRMFLTTPAMFSDSETDSWMASPSFWIRTSEGDTSGGQVTERCLGQLSLAVERITQRAQPIDRAVRVERE